MQFSIGQRELNKYLEFVISEEVSCQLFENRMCVCVCMCVYGEEVFVAKKGRKKEKQDDCSGNSETFSGI